MRRESEDGGILLGESSPGPGVAHPPDHLILHSAPARLTKHSKTGTASGQVEWSSHTKHSRNTRNKLVPKFQYSFTANK